jgi:CRP-like cAMP-binding protein
MNRPGDAFMRTSSVIVRAETLQNEHEEHERRLLKKYERRAAKQRRHTMQRVEARAVLRRSKALAKVEMFRTLSSTQIEALIGEMVFEKHARGTAIVTEGQTANAFFVIIRGTCAVFTRCSRESRLGLLGPLDVFGENSLVDGTHDCQNADRAGSRTRNATVVVESDTAQTLKLTAASFMALVASGQFRSQASDMLETAKRVSQQRHAENLASISGELEKETE